VNGQSRSFGGLPVLSPKNEVIYEGNLNHLPEYNHIYSIYERLVEAKGDRRLPVPELNLRNEEAYVASMDYLKLDISLEKKAYDIAQKYGDEAIAFLLSHELIHYYEKHGWRSQYSDAISDLETGKLLKAVDDRVTHEVQADVLGGFLAYSAGFGIFEKGDLLIEDLYSSYGMKNKIPGYPSKKDRIILAQRNAVQMGKLADVYEMAGLMTIIGKYREAYAYYGYLLNKYQSREMYNNAGLTCMMAASSYMDPRILIFQMPGILDIEFSGDARNASNKAKIDTLINEALNHLETAILMNRNYLPPYINKTSAYIIQGLNQTDSERRQLSMTKARHTLEVEISDIVYSQSDVDVNLFSDEILVLKAILEYYMGDQPSARQMMEQAVHEGSETAVKNLALMDKQAMTDAINPSSVKIQMDGMDAEKFLSSGLVSRNQTHIKDQHIFRITNQSSKNYKVLTHEFKGNDQEFGYDLGFVISKPGFNTEFIDGLSLGTDKSLVLEKLGPPKKVLSHLKGEIMQFENGVIIMTDQDHKVLKVIDYAEILKP
jgi:hypothetical protein